MSLNFEWRLFEIKIGNDKVSMEIKPLTRKGNLILITNADLLSRGQNLKEESTNQIKEFLQDVDKFLDEFENSFIECVKNLILNNEIEISINEFYNSPKAMMAVFEIINELSKISNLTENEVKN